jgi:hypothetical protein
MSAESPELDLTECSRFVSFWSEMTGTPHITLTAITPDGGTRTRSFPRGASDAAGAWIAEEQRNGRNIYFQPNETPPNCASKPAKATMVAALCRHADVDPDDKQFALSEERDRLSRLAEYLIADSRMRPTVLIDSGNGLQPLWVVSRETLPGALERIEAENRALEQALGASGTQNVDRLLRLPGTVNIPGAAKRRRGRVPVRARLIDAAPITYDAADAARFGPYWAVALQGTGLVRSLTPTSVTAKPRRTEPARVRSPEISTDRAGGLDFGAARPAAEREKAGIAQITAAEPGKAGLPAMLAAEAGVLAIGVDADSDDWAVRLPAATVGLDPEEMRRLLLKIPAYETYPEWLSVISAVSHEYQDNPAIALELAHFYSARTLSYDPAEVIRKMASFRRNWEPGAKTARYLIWLAKETERSAAEEQQAAVETAIRTASDVTALLRAAGEAKRVPLEPPRRNIVAAQLRDRWKLVTGTTLGLRESREMVRFEDPERRTAPPWLKGFVYVMADSTFFHQPSGTSLSRQAFNDAHARQVLTRRDVLEGRAYPEVPPAEFALNVVQIPIAMARMYMPDQPELFNVNSVPHANTYIAKDVPEVPLVLSRAERSDVERVKRHFAHLMEDERERAIAISWFAYLVQTGRRANFALMIQGVESDGKTWFRHLMAAVLGPRNVGILNGSILKSDFNSWAEGKQINVAEEVRLIGHNRHDILNQIKPLITNSTVLIHPKGKSPYEVPNTAAYLLLTNYRDALPVGDNDSRYFIVMSRWQVKAKLDAWRQENPRYYPELYRAIGRSDGAIRGWLLGYELHLEFDPAARAPESIGRSYMTEVTKSEDRQGIDATLAESRRPDLCRALLSTTALTDALAEMEDEIVPVTRTLNKALLEMGFTFLGRMVLDGRKCRLWSQEPERFTLRGELQPDLVRKYLDFGGL